jgi:hypothetical protein
MAAVTVAARGDSGYVDPNQRVISRGWVSGTHQLTRVPRRRPGRTLFVTIAADADTLTISNWRGPVPSCSVVVNTENTTATAYPALSGTTLTITFQTDAASSGWLHIDSDAPLGA